MTPPGIERYIAFMSGLSPASLAGVDAIVTDDMHFVDPFNDVRGRAHFVRCLEDMLTQLADLRIEVTHAGELAPSPGVIEPLPRWALYWRFGGHLVRLGGKRWDVTGVAVVSLAADGRVCEHLDYWDAGGGCTKRCPSSAGSCAGCADASRCTEAGEGPQTTTARRNSAMAMSFSPTGTPA